MASYDYRAKTSSGQVVTGHFDAMDRNAVISMLRGKGFYPMDIIENKAAGKEIRSNNLKKVTPKDLSIFCRQFYTMIDAGVTVLGCLDMLRNQTENTRLAEVLNKVYDDVQKGRSLSESMKTHQKVFPVMLTSMMEVGEVSGTLDKVLERLSVHFEKDNKMKSKIKTAMTYPSVIGCITVVMVIFMLVFIFPRFVGMFRSIGAKLPLPTQILLNISNTLTNPVFILGIVVFISLFAYLFSKFKKSESGKFIIDRAVLNIPVIKGNIRKILASRFTRTLSSLLNSGVPLLQSLEVVDKVVDNQLVTKGLIKVKEEIKRGSDLAGALANMGIFPAMVTQMVSIGEEAGSLDSIMEKVATFYDDEVETAISRLIALLEPLMLFVLAGIIGSIVVSMMLPIFSMYNSIGK